MIQRLVIPNYRPPLLNQLMRSTLRKRMRLEAECRDMVSYYSMNEGKWITAATGKRRVSLEITLGERQRESDADSLWKATLDALVACHLLRGDKVADVELGPVTFSRGERKTVVVLEDLP